jgi:hypothetical protein
MSDPKEYGCTPYPSHRFYGIHVTGSRPVPSGRSENFRTDGNGTAKPSETTAADGG